MIIRIALLIIVVSISSFALEVKRNKNSEIILSSRSQGSGRGCAKLEQQLKALKNWQGIEAAQNCKSKVRRRGNPNNPICELNIHDCLPEQIKKYHDGKADLDGPNCFNLALNLKGIVPSLRYSPANEVRFYLRSPLCRILKLNEKPKAGDVGIIKEYIGDSPDLVHGFIYVSEDLVYSKNGKDKKAPFALQERKEVYRLYGLGAAEAKCKANQMPKECDQGVEIHRCKSMDEFLKEYKGDKEILNMYQQTRNLDCKAGNASLNDNHLTKWYRKDIAYHYEYLHKYFKKELNSDNFNKLSEEELFLLTSLKLNLSSMESQFKEHYYNNPSSDSKMQNLGGLIQDIESIKNSK